MKELGRSTQKMLTTKDHWSKLLTYITDVVQPEETNRWKSINTHTQRVVSIGTVSICSSLISGETHVLEWHMYLTGWDLILFLLSYFLLKMVLVMNELHCHKKNRHLIDKNSQTTMIWCNYKIKNLITKSRFKSNTLHERLFVNVLQNRWYS